MRRGFFVPGLLPTPNPLPTFALPKTTPGDVTEWLGRGLQNLLRRFESARHLSSNASKSPISYPADGAFFVLVRPGNMFWPRNAYIS